jgi:hypothetical protein
VSETSLNARRSPGRQARIPIHPAQGWSTPRKRPRAATSLRLLNEASRSVRAPRMAAPGNGTTQARESAAHELVIQRLALGNGAPPYLNWHTNDTGSAECLLPPVASDAGSRLRGGWVHDFVDGAWACHRVSLPEDVGQCPARPTRRRPARPERHHCSALQHSGRGSGASQRRTGALPCGGDIVARCEPR